MVPHESPQKPKVVINPERLRAQAFFEIVREVIDRCTDLHFSESKVRTLVGQLKQALRRTPLGYDLDVDEAITNPEKAQEGILKFIRGDTPYGKSIKPEYADLSTAQAGRAAKFRKALVVEAPAPEAMANRERLQTEMKAERPIEVGGSGARPKTSSKSGSRKDGKDENVLQRQSLRSSDIYMML